MCRATAARRAVTVIAVAVAALIAASASATPEIDAKKAEAQRVLEQIAEMDAALEDATEAFNGATVELDRLDQEIARNRRHLELARSTFGAAQRNLEDRVVALYQGGEDDVLEVILGATSLDDLLDRIDTANRISAQDADILESVKQARAEIAKRERELEQARERQAAVVADRAAKREWIEGQLATRQSLYDSIEDQIQDLVAAERERAQRLAEEARRQQAERERLAAAAGVDVSAVAVPAIPDGSGTAPPSQLGAQAVGIALGYLGVPYVWGGMSPSGFDCSGLVAYVYAQLGVSLPHHAATMYGYGAPVSYGELQPGDLVFFRGLGHMGMYVGNGSYIHAPQTGDVVKISSMSSRSDFVGARRVG